MKIKLPEILAALFLCLSDINPQISVYGLSERNYYNDVLYRQKHGSNLDIHNIPRYQRKRFISRNARDPSDTDIVHTTDSEAYLHNQRNSTVTKFLTNNNVKIRLRRCPDKFSEESEPNVKAVITFEKQSLTLEINRDSSQSSTTGKELKASGGLRMMLAAPSSTIGELCKVSGCFEMMPAAPSSAACEICKTSAVPSCRRSTTHQTTRCATTEESCRPRRSTTHQTTRCATTEESCRPRRSTTHQTTRCVTTKETCRPRRSTTHQTTRCTTTKETYRPRRSTTHQTTRCTTTKETCNPVHQRVKLTKSCEHTSRLNCTPRAVVYRIGSNTTVVFPMSTTPCPIGLIAVPTSRVLLALPPPKQNKIYNPVSLDAFALAPIQSLLEKIKRFKGKGTIVDIVPHQTVYQTDAHLKSNSTTHTSQEETDQHETNVSPPSCSTTESVSQERSLEEIYNGTSTDKPEVTTEDYQEMVNDTSPE